MGYAPSVLVVLLSSCLTKSSILLIATHESKMDRKVAKKKRRKMPLIIDYAPGEHRLEFDETKI